MFLGNGQLLYWMFADDVLETVFVVVVCRSSDHRTATSVAMIFVAMAARTIQVMSFLCEVAVTFQCTISLLQQKPGCTNDLSTNELCCGMCSQSFGAFLEF